MGANLIATIFLLPALILLLGRETMRKIDMAEEIWRSCESPRIKKYAHSHRSPFMNQRSVFASFSLLLLFALQLVLQADPEGEKFVNQNLNQSAHRNAIFIMGVDYQEGERNPLTLNSPG